MTTPSPASARGVSGGEVERSGRPASRQKPQAVASLDVAERLRIVEEAERIGRERGEWWRGVTPPRRGWEWLPAEDYFLLLTTPEIPRTVQADVLGRSYNAVCSRYWYLTARRGWTTAA